MARPDRQINEEKTAAASYILTFYQEVANLTHHYAQYKNLLVEVQMKVDGTEMPGLEEKEKTVFIQTLQSFRYYAHKAQIQYQCIIESMGLSIDPMIIETYNKLEKEFVIERKEAEKYTVLMNTVLLKSIIKNLMETSQSIVDTVYQDA